MPQSSLILTAVTLLVSAIVGLFIVRSVKKEVALRESLEIANQNQTALIHFISHQLKGFFTKSKMVFSGILEGDFGEVNSTIKDMAKTGLDSDNNAVAMIQDILGASNLKTGTTNFNFKNIVLNDVIKKVCGIFKEEMSKKGLQFETDITDKPLTASVDETQITQVFKNLIDNSLRYTPTGKIIVSLMPNSDGKKAVFEVSDTGVGLSDNDKLKLFTEGGKGEESLKINTNSTGYGLYIVKKIVTSHNGNVWAESAGRGHGSQFYVELPTIAQSSV
jgi:signal transduction histidine kinase